MKIDYPITPEASMHAFKAHTNLRHRNQWRRHTILALFILGIGLFSLVRGLSADNGHLIIPVILIISGITVLLKKFLYFRQVKKLLIKGLPALEEQSLLVMEDELHFSKPFANSQFQWPAIVEGHLAKGGILLYLNQHSYIWIPETAHFENGDWEQFTQMVAKKIRIT